MSIFNSLFKRRGVNEKDTLPKIEVFEGHIPNDDLQPKTKNVRLFIHRRNRNPVVPQEANAYVRVSKDGSVHIPSSEIAQLPEVQEMQRMAMRIISRKINQG